MPLTPEEQQELAQLHAKYAPQQQGGLSPAEQAELAQLHQKYGGQTQPSDKMPEGSLAPRGAAQQDIKDVEAMDPRTRDFTAKMAIGSLAGGLGGEAAVGLGALGRASINAGVGGLQKYLGNVIDKKDDRTDGVAGAMALGGGISAGADAAGAGASKLSDYLMQKASGMRKYLPGVGNKLVDQGLIGTRGMLRNQVEDKLPQAEQAVQNAVSGISGNSDSEPIADAISNLGGKFKLPSSGEVGPGMQGYADKVGDAANEFRSMGEGGELTPQDLLSVKRQGDWVGYTNSGTPATSLESDIGRAQADKARELLNTLSNGKTSDTLAQEQALILAKKALTKPDAIHQGMGSTMFFGKVPGQSLFGSTAAQALQKGVATPAQTIADPAVLQTLFGAGNASSGGAK